MRHTLRLLLAAAALLLAQCGGISAQRQVRASRTVVLDIGHYYAPGRGGQGARTPDARYGATIEECEFWYRYARYVKEEIERAGYTCRVCNRGALPTDAALAHCARTADVHQVNTPVPTGIYRSAHHPARMAVGMLSVDYALRQAPAAVIFLHHNSDSDTWRISHKGAFYTNECGVELGYAMAQTMNQRLLNHSLPNGGQPCGVIIRTDGRKGGGDWLNACNESYVPAVITEVAFLSNPEHARWLSHPANAQTYARTLAQGIIHYLNHR